MVIWTTPKTDWDTNTGILYDDLNDIGNNLQYLKDNQSGSTDGLRSYLNGFELDANNSHAPGTNLLRVKGGQCITSPLSAVQGFISWDRTATKILNATTWAAGNGATIPCLSPGASYALNKWFFVFVLYNPTTLARDIVVDDDITGANIAGSTIESSSGFTMWRRIGALKTSDLLAASGIIPVTGRNQIFELSGAVAARQVVQAITTTPALTTLQDSNNISLLPSDGVTNDDDYPIYLDLDSATTSPQHVSTWNTLNGATYYAGIGLESYLNTVAGDRIPDKIHIAPRQNYLYFVRSGGSNFNLNVTLLNYVDTCEHN